LSEQTIRESTSRYSAVGTWSADWAYVQAFKSLHHLTHAANQLETAFSKTFEIKKCGLEMGDAMGGRLNDGRTENITIEYDSEIAGTGGWKAFTAELKKLEDEWDHEGMSVL
jgi:hypothetical protein